MGGGRIRGIPFCKSSSSVYLPYNPKTNPLEREQTFQIRARAERTSFTGHDSNPERRLTVQPLPDAVELRVSRGVDAVEVFRP